MKKKLVTALLIASFINTNISTAYAFGGKNSNAEQNKPQKIKVEKVKIKKQKKVKWTKLQISNKFDFVNLNWWDSFQDDYLTEYIQKAVDHNHNAKIASLTVDEYIQNVKAQRAGELPTIGGGFIPGYGGSGSKTNGTMMFPILVNYEVDLFLKNHDKTKSVKKALEASIQEERATYITIVSAVGTTYFNIVQLDKLIENQKHLIELNKEILNAVVISQEEGVASVSDVIKAEKSLNSAQANLLDFEKTRLIALNQLAVLIGESPANTATFERAKYEDIIYRYDIPNEVSSEIITNRPDYLKAEIMLQKAGIDIRVAKKEFLPSINIGGLALFNALNPAGGLIPNFAWGVGGGIFQSLFTGGAKMANLKINKVRYEKMFKTYQHTNLVSIQEVNDAMYSYKYTNEKYEQNNKNLALETKDFELSKLMYEEGIMSKLDLNKKEETYLKLENLVVQNLTGCLIDSIGYYKATGAGINKTLKLSFK